jgi:hypothetical protein
VKKWEIPELRDMLVPKVRRRMGWRSELLGAFRVNMAGTQRNLRAYTYPVRAMLAGKNRRVSTIWHRRINATELLLVRGWDRVAGMSRAADAKWHQPLAISGPVSYDLTGEFKTI